MHVSGEMLRKRAPVSFLGNERVCLLKKFARVALQCFNWSHLGFPWVLDFACRFSSLLVGERLQTRLQSGAPQLCRCVLAKVLTCNPLQNLNSMLDSHACEQNVGKNNAHLITLGYLYFEVWIYFGWYEYVSLWHGTLRSKNDLHCFVFFLVSVRGCLQRIFSFFDLLSHDDASTNHR